MHKRVEIRFVVNGKPYTGFQLKEENFKDYDELADEARNRILNELDQEELEEE